MSFDNRKIAGALLFVGVVQVILLQIICQTVYPNYSVGQQAISDLGNWNLAGNFAAVFSVSAVLFGLFITAGAILVRNELKNRLFVSLLVLVGLCNIGVGVVAEEISRLHGIFFLIMSLAWVAAAILSYRLVKSPFSYLSVGLGTLSLVIFIFSILGEYVSSSWIFGFGIGGMERLSVYPVWLWTIGFGGYLMSVGSTTVQTTKR
jgi:hypothetical membrane protein